MKRFGKYLLVRKISSGGMADVYVARTIGIRGFSKTVAIKRIYPHLLERERFVRMFTDEAKIAARLDHPNIVQIHDLGEHDGVPYIAMDYVAGCDLHFLLQRLAEVGEQLPIAFACRVLVNICDALHYAHCFRSPDGRPQEIVHRDVSPRNVLLGYDGSVKLTDFGIARAQDREEQTDHGLIKGKARYLSPEAVKGSAIDHRSDIFSLGSVFVETLIMKPLFGGTDKIAALLAIREGKIDRSRIEGVPSRLRPVVDRALQLDPKDRFPSALAFKQALLAELGEGAVLSASDAAVLMHRLFAVEIAAESVMEQEVERYLAEQPVEDGATTQPVGSPVPLQQPADDQEDAQEEVRESEEPTAVRVLDDEEPPPAPPLQARMEINRIEGLKLPSETAKSLKPDIKGELNQESVPHLLHRLAINHETGQIVFRREPIVKSIFVTDGQPVFAASNVEAEMFGEHLVSRGLLTRKQHAAVVNLAKRKPLPLTEALLALGVFQPHELFRHLADQVRERILELFTWTGGSFSFFRDQTPPESGVDLNLRMHTLIRDGVGERVPMAVIRRVLQSRRDQRPLRIRGNLHDGLVLSGREQRILRLIESQQYTVNQIIKREKSEERVLRLIYLLTETGYLTLLDA